MTFTCQVKRSMAGNTQSKGVSGHLSFYMNFSGYKVIIIQIWGLSNNGYKEIVYEI